MKTNLKRKESLFRIFSLESFLDERNTFALETFADSFVRRINYFIRVRSFTISKYEIPFSHDDKQYDIEVYLVLRTIFYILNIDEI